MLSFKKDAIVIDFPPQEGDKDCSLLKVYWKDFSQRPDAQMRIWKSKDRWTSHHQESWFFSIMKFEILFTVSFSGWSNPKSSVCPCPAAVYMLLALFYLNVLHSLHNITGLHKYTHSLIHAHRHTYEDARPKTHQKTRRTHINTHAYTPDGVLPTDTHWHIQTRTHTHTHLQYASFGDCSLRRLGRFV